MKKIKIIQQMAPALNKEMEFNFFAPFRVWGKQKSIICIDHQSCFHSITS